nr:unnamed protein product [Spirometra erinaceieuropaei]
MNPKTTLMDLSGPSVENAVGTKTKEPLDRQNCVVIHSTSESNAPTPKERISADLAMFQHLFSNRLNSNRKVTIRSAFRIDFLSTFNLIVDCRQFRLYHKTINLTVRNISSPDASRQLAVVDSQPENPCRQLPVKYPGLSRPNFSVSTPSHSVVHHIQTTGPPVSSRPRRLEAARVAVAKAEFEHMLQSPILFHRRLRPYVVPRPIFQTSAIETSGHGKFLLPVPLSLCNTILSLTSLLSGPKGSLELSTDALAAFDEVKAALAEDTLIACFNPDAPISLMVDLSNVAVGAVLQQHLAGLAFFSRKMLPSEACFDAFGREFFAVFLATKLFQLFLEIREFTAFSDHKPLSFALKRTSGKLNPREIIRLN